MLPMEKTMKIRTRIEIHLYLAQMRAIKTKKIRRVKMMRVMWRLLMRQVLPAKIRVKMTIKTKALRRYHNQTTRFEKKAMETI